MMVGPNGEAMWLDEEVRSVLWAMQARRYAQVVYMIHAFEHEIQRLKNVGQEPCAEFLRAVTSALVHLCNEKEYRVGESEVDRWTW